MLSISITLNFLLVHLIKVGRSVMGMVNQSGMGFFFYSSIDEGFESLSII